MEQMINDAVARITEAEKLGFTDVHMDFEHAGVIWSVSREFFGKGFVVIGRISEPAEDAKC